MLTKPASTSQLSFYSTFEEQLSHCHPLYILANQLMVSLLILKHVRNLSDESVVEQDYFSNELGYAFYNEYGVALKYNPAALADFLITFLFDRSKRNETSDPNRCP